MDDDEDVALLEHLVKITDGMTRYSIPRMTAQAVQDPRIIRDETLNIMVAGRDTVSASYLLQTLPLKIQNLDSCSNHFCSILIGRDSTCS